jgi:hypothetical protein
MATKKANKAETPSILDYFAEMPDPRRNNQNIRHKLIDLIAIAILATICGAEHFTEMEEWGEDNADWLCSFLELPNGIPSHDTFGDLFAKLDPTEFKLSGGMTSRRFFYWEVRKRPLKFAPDLPQMRVIYILLCRKIHPIV